MLSTRGTIRVHAKSLFAPALTVPDAALRTPITALRRPVAALIAALVMALAPAGISAQQPAPAADAVAYDPALFDALEWENIGPERGGRSQDRKSVV